MSALKKLTALIICIAMLCICLVSCDEILGNNQGNNQNGDVELQSDNYVASIRIKYATNDDKMKAAIDAMGTPDTTLTVMGDELKLESEATLNSISVDNEYVYIGGVLYHTNTVTVADKGITSLKKAEMDESKIDSLISKAGAGATIDLGDFITHEMTTSGDITTFTCTEMDEESKASLTEIFASKFNGLGAIVRLESVSYILDVKNDRNQSSTLSCDFVIDLDGETYELTMHLYCDYNYDAEVSITAPDNADAYTDATVDEILG